MNKIFKNVLCISATLLTAGSVLSLTACGGGGGEAIDKTKIQLFVHNFAGGFGSEWIQDVKTKYEALHAEDEYSNGRKGVQVLITGDKKVYDGPEFRSNNYDVYFAERAKYPYYVSNGFVGEITEAVTNPNPYDNGKTIASKMDATQLEFYGYNEGGTTKYFGIPHYSGTYSITYNVDLFKEKGFYYAKDHVDVNDPSFDPNLAFCYFEDDRAPGPDGIEGTFDDGLPETFDEFYKLCDYMFSVNVYPLVWPGSNDVDYTAALTASLLASLQGATEGKINYSFEGTLSNLIQFDNEGKMKFDAQGNPLLDHNVVITEENGYEVTRSLERYQALSFLNKLFETKNWLNPQSKNGSTTQMNSQEIFISGVTDGEDLDSAMLIDGSWWQAEATAHFNYMAQNYEGKQTPLERDFAIMPFPKANKNDAYHPVYLDVLNSLQFIKPNLNAEKKALAMDFLQFVNSDEMLVKFTKTTYTTRCLNYEMSNSDLAEVSLYGRSVYEYKNEVADQLYPFSKTSAYANHQESFEPCFIFKTKLDKTAYTYPGEVFKPKAKGTVQEVFEGTFNLFKDTWSSYYKAAN